MVATLARCHEQDKLMNFSLSPLLQGFALGASLIVAIGAQNAFVLRQGLKRLHVFITAAICTLCDAILIILVALRLFA